MFGPEIAKTMVQGLGRVRGGSPGAPPSGSMQTGGRRLGMMQGVLQGAQGALQRRQRAAPAAPPTAGGGGTMGAPQTSVRVYSNGGKVYNRKPNGKAC